MLGIFKSNKLFDLSKGFGYAEEKIRSSAKNNVDLADKLRILAKISFESYPYDSLRIMKESYELFPQTTKVKWLGFRMYDLGDLRNSYENLSQLPECAFVSDSEHRKFRKIVDEYQYLKLIDSDTPEDEMKVKTRSEFLQMKSYNTQGEWMYSSLKQILNFKNVDSQKFFKPSSKKIAIICDEAFFQYVKPSADFVYLTPNNYARLFNSSAEESSNSSKLIDILLVVSNWMGIDSAWRGMSFVPESKNSYTVQRITAINCIKYCASNNIPIVFYNIDDALYLSYFLEFATLADFVYTADASTVKTLKEICTNAKLVEYLPLGVNPLMHNPVGMNYKVEPNSVVYSGVWFSENEDKVKELSRIINGVISTKFSLHILDSAASIIDKKYNYPDSLKKYISGSAEYDDIVKIHKTASWSIAYNPSVNGSRLVSSRTFELLASGCNILSNYNEEIVNVLPTIFLVNTNTDVANFMKRNKPNNLYMRKLFGIRTIMNNHTCFNNINKILVNVGLEESNKSPRILVIGDHTNHNSKNFNRQTYSEKTFIDQKDVTIGIASEFEAITWFDDNIYYEEFYLEDMMNAFKYTDADYVTKDSYCIQESKSKQILHSGIEHNYVEGFKDKATTIFWRKSFNLNSLLDNKESFQVTIDSVLSSKSLKGYSTDRANVIKNYNTFIDFSTRSSHFKYRISVIIPVFNNGSYLLNYSFSSLQNLSLFNEMEIIIVDDGSTERTTISIINYLTMRYSNVRSFFFNDGGSGSASRPRNKGIEMSTGEFILFFDPDDQCVGDGYSQLICETNKEDIDLVVGNNYMLGKERAETNNYKYFLDVFKTDIYTSMNGISESLIGFRTVRIQSMLIFAKFLKNSRLTFKEGAIGEDTLFSWQLLKLARSVKFSNNFTHTYFSARENSVTNTFNVSMFKKLAIIQQDKINWLRDNSELELFMEQKFESYVKNTLLERLNKVTDDEKDECKALVKNILSIYKPFYRGNDDELLKILDI